MHRKGDMLELMTTILLQMKCVGFWYIWYRAEDKGRGQKEEVKGKGKKESTRGEPKLIMIAEESQKRMKRSAGRASSAPFNALPHAFVPDLHLLCPLPH